MHYFLLKGEVLPLLKPVKYRLLFQNNASSGQNHFRQNYLNWHLIQLAMPSETILSDNLAQPALHPILFDKNW